MSNPYEEMRKMSVADICKSLGAQASLFVAIGLLLWWISDRPLTGFVTVDFRQIALGIGLGLAMIAVAAVIFHGFPQLAEKLTRLQSKNFAFLEKRLSLPVIIFFSICAGVGEEALFRGGLQTLMSDYVSLPLAIIFASLIFALIHFAKPLIAVIIFAIGASFGLFYIWSGSLLAVMIGHALYDVYAIWFLQKEMHRLQLFESPQHTGSADQEPATG